MTVSHILVATDGSSCATAAVQWAAELGAQTGARVTAVHVFEPLGHLTGAGPIDLADLRRQAAADLDAQWTRPLSECGVRFDSKVVEGRPAEAIADTSADVGSDLIVVGARGLSAIKRVALGSTSQKLPHITETPVAIVPYAT